MCAPRSSYSIAKSDQELVVALQNHLFDAPSLHNARRHAQLISRASATALAGALAEQLKFARDPARSRIFSALEGAAYLFWLVYNYSNSPEVLLAVVKIFRELSAHKDGCAVLLDIDCLMCELSELASSHVETFQQVGLLFLNMLNCSSVLIGEQRGMMTVYLADQLNAFREGAKLLENPNRLLNFLCLTEGLYEALKLFLDPRAVEFSPEIDRELYVWVNSQLAAFKILQGQQILSSSSGNIFPAIARERDQWYSPASNPVKKGADQQPATIPDEATAAACSSNKNFGREFMNMFRVFGSGEKGKGGTPPPAI
jgi:hypothetical protein